MIIENANIELDRDSRVIICERSSIKNCLIIVHDKGAGMHHPIEVLPRGVLVGTKILNALGRDCILVHPEAIFAGCGVFKYIEEEGEEETLWGPFPG